MGNLIFKKDKFYSNQPPPGAKVIWGHPLAYGFIGGWIFNNPNSKFVEDLAGKRKGTIYKPVWKAGEFGLALNPNGTNTLCVRMDDNKIFDSLSSVSIVSGIYFNGFVSEFQHIVRNDAICNFQLSTTASRLNLSTALSITYLPPTKKWITFGVSWSTKLYPYNSPIFYTDGKLSGVVAAGKTTVIGAATNPFYLLNSANDGSEDLQGACSFVYIWNRVLTNTEHLTLRQSPYQFINPPQRNAYFFITTGAALSIDVTVSATRISYSAAIRTATYSAQKNSFVAATRVSYSARVRTATISNQKNSYSTAARCNASLRLGSVTLSNQKNSFSTATRLSASLVVGAATVTVSGGGNVAVSATTVRASLSVIAPTVQTNLSFWDLTADCLAQWKCNDNAPTYNVLDSVGAYHMTADSFSSVLSSTSGKFNRAFDFAVANSKHASIADQVPLRLDEFTITFWMKRKKSQSSAYEPEAEPYVTGVGATTTYLTKASVIGAASAGSGYIVDYPFTAENFGPINNYPKLAITNKSISSLFCRLEVVRDGVVVGTVELAPGAVSATNTWFDGYQITNAGIRHWVPESEATLYHYKIYSYGTQNFYADYLSFDVYHNTPVGKNNDWSFWADGTSWECQIATGRRSCSFSASIAPTGAWTFVCGSFNRYDQIMRVWANGIRRNNTALGGTYPISWSSANAIQIGGKSLTISTLFYGDVDNVCFFNKELSDFEVDWLYNFGNGTETLRRGDVNPYVDAEFTAITEGAADVFAQRNVSITASRLSVSVRTGTATPTAQKNSYVSTNRIASYFAVRQPTFNVQKSVFITVSLVSAKLVVGVATVTIINPSEPGTSVGITDIIIIYSRITKEELSQSRITKEYSGKSRIDKYIDSGSTFAKTSNANSRIEKFILEESPFV